MSAFPTLSPNTGWMGPDALSEQLPPWDTECVQVEEGKREKKKEIPTPTLPLGSSNRYKPHPLYRLLGGKKYFPWLEMTQLEKVNKIPLSVTLCETVNKGPLCRLYSDKKAENERGLLIAPWYNSQHVAGAQPQALCFSHVCVYAPMAREGAYLYDLWGCWCQAGDTAIHT